jgi:hypothetical protein
MVEFEKIRTRPGKIHLSGEKAAKAGPPAIHSIKVRVSSPRR